MDKFIRQIQRKLKQVEEKEQGDYENKLDFLIKLFIVRYQREIAVSLLTVIFLAGLVLANWWVKKPSKEPIVIESVSENTGDDSVSITEGEKVVVDIAGGVNKPGVYKLNEGSRLKDLVEIAEGLSDDADREYLAKNINLAQVLEDGVKAYIPKLSDTCVGGECRVSDGIKDQQSKEAVAGIVVSNDKVNINTATQAKLETLSGVGPKTAAKIAEGRPYEKIEDILKVSGIGPKTFTKLKDKIKVK